MTRRIAFAVAVLAAGAFSACSALGGVVIADRFDTPDTMNNWPGDKVFKSDPAGANASVDHVGPKAYGLCAPGRGNCVDMDGTTGSGNKPAGRLVSVKTVPAGDYTLSFTLIGNQRGAPPQTTQVTLGDFADKLTMGSNDPLRHYKRSFHTIGGKLVFTEVGPSTQFGAILDDVVLSAGR